MKPELKVVELSVSSAPDCSFPGFHGANCACAKPMQATIVASALSEAELHLPHASDAELDALISKIESLKLARLIRQRAQLEASMDDAHRGIGAMQASWASLQRSISSMIQRGVL